MEDPRIRPLASLRIYLPGQGDPYQLLRSYAWYDVLAESHRFGAASFTSTAPTLEYVPDIGLACRPFLALQDTRLSQFSVSGGSWEERRPATGTPRKYRLVQYSTTADTVWSATSGYNLPENPDLAFSFLLPDAPADANSTTTPPYVAVVLGVDGLGGGNHQTWRLLWRDDYGGLLQQWVAGAWETVSPLSELLTRLNDANREATVFLRCLRNRICVSTDFGRTYTTYGSDVTPAVIRAGRLQFQGQNRQAVVGVHQLAYVTGTYTSPTRAMLPPNRLSATPSIGWAGGEYKPTGTSITYADLGTFTAAANVARYRATLQPDDESAVPFAVWRTPVLASVLYALDPVPLLTSGLYETPYDDLLLRVSFQKPRELDQAAVEITARKDGLTQFSWPYARWPKAVLLLGELGTDGETVTWLEEFWGYVRKPVVSSSEYNKATVALSLDNATARFKDAEWTDFDARPFGGVTLNTALDLILATEGIPLNASYRIWHPAGDLFLFPYGAPEDPFEWPRRGEKKWETMTRLASYAGLEIALRDDGALETVLRDGVFLTVARTLDAANAAQLSHLIQSASVTMDSSETASCVIVYATGLDGSRLYAYAVDTEAELNPANGRFGPWRTVVQEEMPGTVTLGMLTARCQFLAREHFGLKVDAAVGLPLNLEIGRRELDILAGLFVGALEHERYVVDVINHEVLPVLADSGTALNLRRAG